MCTGPCPHPPALGWPKEWKCIAYCKLQAASFEPSDAPSSKSGAHSKFTVSNFAVPESGLEKAYSNACAEDSLVVHRPEDFDMEACLNRECLISVE
jgi:hypothetical protein